MPAVKGKTNNPNGRPKSPVNSIASKMRINVVNFLIDNFEKLEAQMKELDPKEYVRAYIDLMKYGIYPAQAPVKEDEPENKDELRKKIIDASLDDTKTE